MVHDEEQEEREKTTANNNLDGKLDYQFWKLHPFTLQNQNQNKNNS